MAAAMKKQLEQADLVPTWSRLGPSIRSALELAIKAVADEFKKDNPNFDAVRFLEACGVGK